MQAIFSIVSTKRNRHALLAIASIIFVLTVATLFALDLHAIEVLPLFSGYIIPSLLIFSIGSRFISLCYVIMLGIKINYKSPAIIFGYFIGISMLNSFFELVHGDIGTTGIEEAMLLAIGGVFLMTTVLILYPLMIEFMETKEKLKSQNGLLLAMLENVPFDFWVRDQRGIQIIQSKAGASMWGELKEQSVQEHHLDPETRALWEQNNLRAAAGEIVKGERKYKLIQTGEERTFFEVIAPYYIDNHLAGIMGINFDITDQKKNEELISVQSSALNAAANGIVITDIHGIVEWTNPAFERMTGYTFAEALGKNVSFLSESGMHSKEYYEELWRTISSGKAWTGEMINRRKDGTLQEEEQTITPVKNADGTIIRFIGIKQDITERKKFEKKIIQSEMNIRSYLSASPYGIFIADANGKYQDVNPAACAMLGYSEQELLSISVPDIIAPDSTAVGMKHFHNLQQFGRADDEIRLLRKDGSTFLARIIAVTLRTVAASVLRRTSRRNERSRTSWAGSIPDWKQ